MNLSRQELFVSVFRSLLSIRFCIDIKWLFGVEKRTCQEETLSFDKSVLVESYCTGNIIYCRWFVLAQLNTNPSDQLQFVLTKKILWISLAVNDLNWPGLDITRPFSLVFVSLVGGTFGILCKMGQVNKRFGHYTIWSLWTWLTFIYYT